MSYCRPFVGVLLALVASVTVSACGRDPVALACPEAPRGLQLLGLTIQSLTTGSPPASVDPAAVRGIVTLTANVLADMIPAAGARVELRVAGRLVAGASVPRSAPGGLTSVPLTVATDARDAGGARLVPNGPQPWAVTLLAGEAARGDCPPAEIGTIVQQLTVTNP